MIRIHRTLVRVLSVDTTADEVYVIFPGWEHKTVVPIKLSSIPEHIQNQMEPNFRCHARIDFNADTIDELNPHDWEE